MEEGQIVLTPLQQSDGKYKKRPALLLKKMPGYGDWLVCGISTQLHQHIKDFDFLISARHPDFTTSGLKASSVIRLGFLAIIPSSAITGAIGNISEPVYRKLIYNLTNYLQS